MSDAVGNDDDTCSVASGLQDTPPRLFYFSLLSFYFFCFPYFPLCFVKIRRKGTQRDQSLFLSTYQQWADQLQRSRFVFTSYFHVSRIFYGSSIVKCFIDRLPFPVNITRDHLIEYAFTMKGLFRHEILPLNCLVIRSFCQYFYSSFVLRELWPVSLIVSCRAIKEMLWLRGRKECHREALFTSVTNLHNVSVPDTKCSRRLWSRNTLRNVTNEKL